tara:strand:- start:979 stop:1185 length:207 start_codon:yes stop_codon:yes gene_type:complete
MNDLDRMKAEFVAKGNKVTVLPATKYEEIVADGQRLKAWGETTKNKRKGKESWQDHIAFEEGGKLDDE